MEQFLWGIWNGITASPLLGLHVFDVWQRYPVYNVGRDGGWYQLGYLIGAGSPLAGMLSSRHAAARQAAAAKTPMQAAPEPK